ncbi:hypothetical protein CONPUDRAFT_72983 [Coniophora puteana RWD-64-598 SS2]|uniref:Uncharacterized protein n=1 Tax=Coniophora puteana (strain RWD-64-598) TaxID=741705 RepID=A0A5M3MQ47_CONPW|nr:uncharacterized protein CONPUDRAFT_72983 [Coniophora puteana RWD-64-598 SS2]EIW81190.1 hypothetical protein CONPUDRAFT_72983 [Coniophora puteana RWD-64-598 SS2]
MSFFLPTAPTPVAPRGFGSEEAPGATSKADSASPFAESPVTGTDFGVMIALESSASSAPAANTVHATARPSADTAGPSISGRLWHHPRGLKFRFLSCGQCIAPESEELWDAKWRNMMFQW